jgi:transposase
MGQEPADLSGAVAARRHPLPPLLQYLPGVPLSESISALR